MAGFQGKSLNQVRRPSAVHERLAARWMGF
jgi:hypothetical protein